MSPENPEPAKLGLREKKKMKTRRTLQQQGMRLFREYGYAATTIEQIAEASEISPSTFFRYFPTKEALVLEDNDDELLIESFRKQPAGISLIQAFRAAAKEGFAGMTREEQTSLAERMALTMSVPELRAASLIHMNDTLLLIAELAADRLDRPRDDFEVMMFAGTIMGAMMAVQLHCFEHPDEDFTAVTDRALALYEKGVPLGTAGL
ncbi:TetR family transcriptional regulator [Paenibacillus sacheonensis]|uniref:TetR family transcriptional regulator n=1 Tax=Paenibacillus sacheonensis TaxID=742054 RepID=A0A7X4YRP7_9BACL|nr:TetR family transcriptional regulator [Paenibacillus sacheonensis]MBM7567575.1 AcrR family transcriptional regulator [Paenibacillus sacheonensis]NBC71322.1 TetR family transcriptional regulator [Paenibacillus sacheonensis]